MEIHNIYQDQFKENSDRIARLRRIKRADIVNKAREMKDSEKDREERRNKKEEVSATVVVSQKEQNSRTTVEITEKASPIGDLYEAQQHMMGQHMGNIAKLRESLNGDVSDKKAIKEVKRSKVKQAEEAYEKSAEYKQTKQSTYENER